MYLHKHNFFFEEKFENMEKFQYSFIKDNCLSLTSSNLFVVLHSFDFPFILIHFQVSLVRREKF